MTHQPYLDYKNSGLEWLDVIPAHWTAIRFKFNFELQKRPVEPGMGVVTAFRDGQVTLRRNRRAGGFTEADKEVGYQGIEPGDLVIHAMDAFAGAIGVSDSRGKSTPVYSVCKPQPNVEAMYFAYVLRHLARVGYIESLAKGIRERSTDFRWADARNVWVPLPPFQEQRHIVDFLERETGGIDAFIADQKELIRLLNERRSATITQTVTKGLNSNVPLKDSGRAWLETVPAHWEVCRLKNILTQRITDGPHTTPTFIDDGIPFLSVDGIQDGELVFDGCRNVSVEDHQQFSRKAAPKRNDILMGKAASTGKIARVKVDFEFSIWSPLALIQIDESANDPRFVEYWLKSLPAQAQIDVLCTNNTQKNISMDDIPKLDLLLPPQQEQRVIADLLDQETANFDAAVAEAQEAIALSIERRAAVISAAVTGKIDVRDCARVKGEPVGVA